MSEEVVEAAEAPVEAETTTEVTESTPETTEASQAFSDTFIGSIEDEELRGKLEGYNLGGKSADDVAKYLAELKSFTGKKGDIPKPDASPEEWAEFYGKLGRPESADAYDVALTDEFKELVGDDSMAHYESMVDTIKAQAFEMGANADQAEAAVTSMIELVAGQLEASNKELAKQAEENEAALKTEWGDGYETISNSVDALMKNNGMTQEQVDWARENGVFSEPALAIPLAKIAAKFADDPEIGHHQTQTQNGIQDQIKETEFQITDYMSRGESVPKHLMEKRNDLYSRAKF
jgi:coenzyme F420-reducing hydrogenase alpha subunit